MIKKVITLMIGATLIGVSSCRKQLDINTNPNVAQEVTPALLLPTAQLEIGSALGVVMNNNASIWVQYWTQSASANQYRTLEQYQPTASDYDRLWTLLYAGALPDLKRIDELAAESGQRQYQAISKILTAYTYQLITDAWGDVPLTEALRGQPEKGGILNPRFDPQSLVYDSIIQMAKDGRSLISIADPSHPTTDDLIYGGEMSYWGAFANTLLLRMYMRLSEVNPAKAQAGIAALATDSLGFLGDFAPDAQINYSTSAGNQNPLSTESRQLGQNQVASKTSADSLNSNNDPRRVAFYNTTSGTVIGLPQGSPVAQTGVTYSLPNPGTTGASNALLTDPSGQDAATAPVKLLTTYESYFLQAEAAARGWMPGNAQLLFETGIKSNFETLGLSETQAESYIDSAYWGKYPTGGTVQQQIRHIITQKWFSMNGTQGFEAWTEWRRTGYPDFLVQSASSLIGAGRFPARFFYPDVEVSRNASFPGQRLIYDRVWWDVN